MATTAADVTVAGTGHIYTAPLGTTVPATLVTPGTGWVEAGYTTENGVTMTQAVNTTELNTWQDANPVRVLTTSRTLTIAAELMEYSPENLVLSLGGGTITKGASTGTVDFPTAGSNAIVMMIVDAVDGAYTFRYVFTRVQADGSVAWNLQKASSVDLPVTWTNLAGTAPQLRSNHPAYLT
jgi:hypothetical protein